MAANRQDKGQGLANPWRIIGWGGIAALLLMPLVAMRFTDAVAWTPGDFLAAGAMLGGVGLGLELAARASRSAAYRVGAGVALAAALLAAWSNLAVGIIGDEGDPANLMFFGVLAAGLAGATLARFRPAGMARAMLATGFAQLAATAIALSTRMIGPVDPELPITLFFAMLWLVSAGLFRKAAADET